MWLKLLISFLAFSTPLGTVAQDTVVIKFKVLDSITLQPFAYSIISTQSYGLAQGVVTDSEGIATIAFYRQPDSPRMVAVSCLCLNERKEFEITPTQVKDNFVLVRLRRMTKKEIREMRSVF